MHAKPPSTRPPVMSEDEAEKIMWKMAVKEAIKEYLNDRAREFGWVSFKFIGGAILAGMLWLFFMSQGWKLP